MVFAEADLPKATSTSALSGAGVLRLFNKVGETVNKFTYRMDESDPVSRLTDPLCTLWWIHLMKSIAVHVVAGIVKSGGDTCITKLHYYTSFLYFLTSQFSNNFEMSCCVVNCKYENNATNVHFIYIFILF